MHLCKCFEVESKLEEMFSKDEMRGGRLDERAAWIIVSKTGARQDCKIVAPDAELTFTETQPPCVAASMIWVLLFASNKMCSIEAMPQRAIMESRARELSSPINTIGQLASPGFRNICSRAAWEDSVSKIPKSGCATASKNAVDD